MKDSTRKDSTRKDSTRKDSTSNPVHRSGANRAVAAGLTLGVIGGTAAGLVFGVPGLTSAASSEVVAEPAATAAVVLEHRPERGERGEGRGHRGGLGSFARGVASEALTDLLGIDAQELRQQLRDGATLAEIAAAQGVEPQAVVDELVGELTERLDNAVENGRLDQAAADEKLAEAEAKITDRVDNGRPDRNGTSTDQAD